MYKKKTALSLNNMLLIEVSQCPFGFRPGELNLLKT